MASKASELEMEINEHRFFFYPPPFHLLYLLPGISHNQTLTAPFYCTLAEKFNVKEKFVSRLRWYKDPIYIIDVLNTIFFPL